MKQQRQNQTTSFSLPLPPVLLIGGGLAAAFYALILLGPLDTELFQRYCLSHPVAVACVSLFLMGLTALVMKWLDTVRQNQLTTRSTTMLQRLVSDGDDVELPQRASWLTANLETLPQSVHASWLIGRVFGALEMQNRRLGKNDLEADLRSLSDADADQQHESQSLLRIIHWAMPMLGFLGTVLGISKTLGQLDTKLLATQQQEAMNQLTAGLYVAFDTTAIALVLTVTSMFIQFAVNRIEMRLLMRIDSQAADTLLGFLDSDASEGHAALLAPVREILGDLIGEIQNLTEHQAAIWSRSIAETYSHWRKWQDSVCEQTETAVGKQLSSALGQHTDRLDQIHSENNRLADLRAQQWQTTLSDQARLLQSSQREIHEQSSLLKELIETTSNLRDIEGETAQKLERIRDIDRLEAASQCIGEAVAVLGTSLERSGVIRHPLKPRRSSATATSSVPASGVSASASTPSVGPTADAGDRKAASDQHGPSKDVATDTDAPQDLDDGQSNRKAA